MKTFHATNLHYIRTLATAVCAVGLGLTTATAQNVLPPQPAPATFSNSGDDIGFFLNGDLGASFMTDFQSSRLGPPADFSVRPGARFGIEPGYNFLSTAKLALGGEFETGVLFNRISGINSPGLPTLRGDLYQVPVLGNLELKMRVSSFVTPFIGVGGGGDASRIRVSEDFITPHPYNRRSSEFDPAVQAMAGVRFHLAPNMDLGFGYKFLAAFPGEGTALENHTAMATLSFKF